MRAHLKPITLYPLYPDCSGAFHGPPTARSDADASFSNPRTAKRQGDRLSAAEPYIHAQERLPLTPPEIVEPVPDVTIKSIEATREAVDSEPMPPVVRGPSMTVRHPTSCQGADHPLYLACKRSLPHPPLPRRHQLSSAPAASAAPPEAVRQRRGCCCCCCPRRPKACRNLE